jgi:hypothetical protein
MHFEENQLSPSSIGFSPLPTPHPNRFQPILVRASTRSYPGFTLDMGRSLGFGSNQCYYFALLELAFATNAYLSILILATLINSPDHYAKGTQSRIFTFGEHSAPTACKRTVSDSISLPFRGSFHLSLAVLLRYRWQNVFSLGRWSCRIPTGFLVSRGTWVSIRSPLPFAYRAFTSFGRQFHAVRLNKDFVTPAKCIHPLLINPTTPIIQRMYALSYNGFRLFPVRSPLLRESLLFSFPPGTKMFQFPRCPSALTDDKTLLLPGFPIRISPDLCLLAAPRSVSSLTTSFIGILPQGIRHTLFVA